MKKYLIVTSIMLGLLFLWWFSGGNIWGFYVTPSPTEKTLAFIGSSLKDINYTVANIFYILFNKK